MLPGKEGPLYWQLVKSGSLAFGCNSHVAAQMLDDTCLFKFGSSTRYLVTASHPLYAMQRVFVPYTPLTFTSLYR